MAVLDQRISDRYSVWNGDSIEVMQSLPKACVGLSIYSPPFAGMYHYTSSERDLSNCATYEQFMQHYEYMVLGIARITKPGRFTVVHCMDVPDSNTGKGDNYKDFPGDIIRLHERMGFRMASPRVTIWKEPLTVRNRTLTKALAHRTIVEDSANCTVAGGDYLLFFRRDGENKEPIMHPTGLSRYAGEREIPKELWRYRGWKGKQTENRYSHWIWRQYASCVWDDIRGNTGTRGVSGVLPYREARDEEDEKHLHPLQLDVIERVCVLKSNPDDIVFTPCMGVGSEVCAALANGRRAMGAELKPSYYRQSLKNIEATLAGGLPTENEDQTDMFADEDAVTTEEVVGAL